MRLLVLIVIIAILLIGQKLFFHQLNGKPSIVTTKLSPSISPSASPTITQQDIHNQENVNPTNTPASQEPTQSQNITGNISMQYPNSQQTNSQGNTMYYQTNDDPTTVTSWYKDRLKSLGMNTTSVIENTVNGNVNNQLVASNNNTTIRITITRNSNQITTTIGVSSN